MALASTRSMRLMHCSREWRDVARTDCRLGSVTISPVIISVLDIGIVEKGIYSPSIQF